LTAIGPENTDGISRKNHVLIKAAGGAANMADENTLKIALDAVERMNKMFALERYIYLSGTVVALALLSYSAFLMIQAGTLTREQGGFLFGSGGLFAISGWRAVIFFSRTFKLVEDILRRIAQLDATP
jgi:hypothetical protein